MNIQIRHLLQLFFLGFCRLTAVIAVILAIKVWLGVPSDSSRPSPMNGVPLQLQAVLVR